MALLISKAALKQLCMLLAAGGIGAGGQVAVPKVRAAYAKPAVHRPAVKPRPPVRRVAPAWRAAALPVAAVPAAPAPAPDCLPVLQPVRIVDGAGQLLPGAPESRVPMTPGDRFLLPGTPVWAAPPAT